MVKPKISKGSKAKQRPESVNVKSKKKNQEQITVTQIEKTENIQSYSGDSIASANPSLNGLTSEWNMKLVSWNINGLRSFIKTKGLEYIREENADIIALQEIKCSKSDIPAEANNINGYKPFWFSGEKAGYAGTGLYSKASPISIKYGIGIGEHDQEGRVITMEYEHFHFVTAYVPNAGRGLVRLPYRKNSWDIDFAKYIAELDQSKPVIVCGDLNVAHNEIDLANPKSNTKNAGFTKDERDGLSNLLKLVDLVDTFRHIYPDRTGAYSFWSNMRGSRSRNIGWRLDYFLISKRLLPNLCNQELRSSVMGSDHCPVVLYMKF